MGEVNEYWVQLPEIGACVDRAARGRHPTAPDSWRRGGWYCACGAPLVAVDATTPSEAAILFLRYMYCFSSYLPEVGDVEEHLVRVQWPDSTITWVRVTARVPGVEYKAVEVHDG